ncbi:TolC family protein [Salisaeta longa]|uniref:TolC family protein n=1 Tax=Salisaeta longa TaxID=503170 RepID=UPI000490AEEC|nr:TolC family protein [Salisaeta longa]
MTVFAPPRWLLACVLVAAWLPVHPMAVAAQNLLPSAPDSSLTLTFERALRVAFANNHALRSASLDVRTADAQVREAWGSVLPSIDVTSSYTRNVVTANPFAGSDVASFLGGGGQADWVAFNERRRLDSDPATDPITFQEFVERQNDSLRAIGVNPNASAGNPFGVDNEFLTGVQLTQTLYNGSAFSAIEGAQSFKNVSQLARVRQRQQVAQSVYEAFYGAMLAQAQAKVAEERVQRSRETLQEITLQVKQGTIPKYQRLSARVQLANQKTQLIQARNNAQRALDNLKRVLGVGADLNVAVRGALQVNDPQRFQQVSLTQALDIAEMQRADLERARLNIELQRVQKDITQAQYFPRLSAVANFAYSGRVPDDRTSIVSDPLDPFAFQRTSSDFFADSYWNPSFSVGLQLTWNIFNGFQTSARVQQDEIAISQAQVQYDRLQQTIRIEVRQALRNLAAARQRLQAQQQNVETAQTNYRYVAQRVRTGVSTQLELREASDQLDQSRLNYLQAAYDLRVARASLRTALGVSLTAPAPEILTTQR